MALGCVASCCCFELLVIVFVDVVVAVDVDVVVGIGGRIVRGSL